MVFVVFRLAIEYEGYGRRVELKGLRFFVCKLAEGEKTTHLHVNM